MKPPEGLLVLSHEDGSTLNLEELDTIRNSISTMIEEGAFDVVPFIISSGVHVQYIPLTENFNPQNQIITGTLRILDTINSKEALLEFEDYRLNNGS